MTQISQNAWAETFRYAAERSPFYRPLLQSYRDVPPLGELPLVDKRTLSERNLDFLCVPRDRVVEIVTTSGTTANPLVWMLTDSDLKRLGENERLSFECAGLTPTDTVLIAVAMDRCFVAGLAYWLGLRELGCSVVRAGASSAALVLELIELTRPTAIIAVPSFLRLIAVRAAETGFDLKSCSVRKAICIGESIRDGFLELTPASQAIQSAWGARLYSTYGVTEFANSLCECDSGTGGHLHSSQLYLEVVDDAGKPVGEGVVGEVVGTTFGVEAMPLIRYRTGDCAALFQAPCACGRPSPRLGPILGRKNQKLKFKGASLFPSTLQFVLEHAEGVESFVIIVRSESELSDSIEVLIHGSASVPALRDLLQARSKVLPQIRQASPAEIEALQLPPNARKRRTFVDLR